MIHYNIYLIDNQTGSILNESIFTCPILISNRALVRKAKKVLDVSDFKSISKVMESGLIQIRLHGSSVHIKLVPI